MKPGTATKSQPSALRYWIVGLGVLVIAILGAWPQTPVRPQGALAQDMESELRMLSGQLGTQVTPVGCTMSGNLNLGVGCQVIPFSLEASKERLVAQGWKPTEIPPLASASDHAAFIKGDRYLSLDAKSSQKLWALSMRAQRE